MFRSEVFQILGGDSFITNCDVRERDAAAVIGHLAPPWQSRRDRRGSLP